MFRAAERCCGGHNSQAPTRDQPLLQCGNPAMRARHGTIPASMSGLRTLGNAGQPDRCQPPHGRGGGPSRRLWIRPPHRDRTPHDREKPPAKPPAKGRIRATGFPAVIFCIAGLNLSS